MRFWQFFSGNFANSARLVVLTGSAIAILTSIIATWGDSKGPANVVSICGSTVEVQIEGNASAALRTGVLRWVRRAGEAVCTYYGKFPVPHVALDVRIRDGSGVHGGVTYPENGGHINISLGKDTPTAEFDEDWMLTHEMIHLAFPSMARKHHWIEEGISVYVEPVARVQAGQLSAERMWHDVVRDMPQGEPESGDRGLDSTHTWGRTYWGGAMFCLVADVRIRQQTHNHEGLQDALRGILEAGGNITQDWPIERALELGDKATGTTVLRDLYREMSEQPDPVDLAALWKQLGIQREHDGSLRFDDAAALAGVRSAITQPEAAPQYGQHSMLSHK